MGLPIVTHEAYVLDAPKVPDAHGNLSRTAKDWPNATRTGPFEACVQPDAATLGASLATTENRDGGREQTEVTVQILFHLGVPIKATHGVEIDGDVYQVQGPPVEWPDVGGLGHIVAKADRVRG